VELQSEMRIINRRDPDTHDIEAPLRMMASSERHLEAFTAQKPLELVQYLQAQGPAPRIYGHVDNEGLWLLPLHAA
jgi:hypothetical protein